MRQYILFSILLLLSFKVFSFCFEPTTEKYTIQKNETLSEILDRFQLRPLYGKNGSVNKVARMNQLKTQDLLIPGQEIFLVKTCSHSITEAPSLTTDQSGLVNQPINEIQQNKSFARHIYAELGLFSSKLDFKSSFLDATVFSKNEMMTALGYKSFFENQDYFYDIQLELIKYNYDTRAISNSKLVVNPTLSLGYQYNNYEFQFQISRQEHPLIISQQPATAEIFWSAAIAPGLSLGYSRELTTGLSVKPNLSVSYLIKENNVTNLKSMISYGFGAELVYLLNSYQLSLRYNFNNLNGKVNNEEHTEVNDKIRLGVGKGF